MRGTTTAPERSFLVGLIGAGIGPSLTPAMHEREAAALGLRLVYRTIDIDVLDLPPEAVGELVRSAPHYGFDGLNITHPCKQLVLPHLDRLAPDAAALGAVNTVVFDGRTAVGHNTDWSGFLGSLEAGLPGARRDRVVLLGAGGAGAAVAHALFTSGTGDLVIADRDVGRARDLARGLAARFPGGSCTAIPPEDLPAHLARADGLVNATPMGMADHPGLPLPAELLDPSTWVADLVYRPLRTALVTAAERRGCPVLPGGRMAVLQAVEAFELITGLTPDRDRVYAHFAELTAD
ncbi:shikimate dehydrogenase [Nocardiopsis sp. CC223A]|uniref:shikimate dehydrogenase n=1 Tax=Nocardiopsis sp. CC223A TaxID=3044051 RepID=UPI00278C2D5C|nr:shikimate dehydrogenase [Nocardiopsis sp. CC223A]